MNVVGQFPFCPSRFFENMKKTLETLSFQGFCVGGDKRDRNADRLNAMRKTPESNVSNVYF